MASGLGFAAVAVPLIAASLEIRAPWVLTYAAMIVFGCGTALSAAPMISTVLEQLPGELAGMAAGLLNALRGQPVRGRDCRRRDDSRAAGVDCVVVDQRRGLCDVCVGRVDVGLRTEMAPG
jgi:hypothetical protein